MKQSTTTGLHPQAAELLGFWREAKGDQILPHRRSLNPVRLRKWINDLSTIEYHEGPKNYFVRLQSEDVPQRIGQNLSRCYLEDALEPASLPAALAPYKKTRETRSVTHSVMTPRLYRGLFAKLERLVLPFTDDHEIGPDSEVDRFLTWVGPADLTSEQPEPVYGFIPHETESHLDSPINLSIFAA